MELVWKLLRQHISIPQFAGFAFANLFGMLIVLFGFQFYKDVLPVFTQQDSFMKADYLIMSKKIGMGNTLSGRTNTFSGSDVDDISSQKFVKKIGKFTSTEYKVDASMGVNGVNVLNSELFFESVPDGFVDVPLKDWKYEPGSQEVPIILPRTYINMYNFGFAQSHSLPKISDGLMGMIDFHIFIQAGVGSLAVAVIGYFSNRFKENPPIMVVVEAGAADCLYRSAVQADGSRVDVTGDMLTIMAGLACGEANTVSWDILRNHANAFVSCPDWVSANGTRIYGCPLPGDKQVTSGESGSVTMGLVHAIMTKPEYADLKEALKLNADSEVLLVSSEGDTDPTRYREIVWDGLCGTDKRPFADLENN